MTLILSLLLAQSASAYENNLSAREQRDFVHAIQSIGSDTWAEGEYQYKYQRVGCDFKRKECWIYFEMKYADRKTIAFCSAENVLEFADVYDKKRKRITDLFFDKIVDCMNTWPE